MVGPDRAQPLDSSDSKVESSAPVPHSFLLAVHSTMPCPLRGTRCRKMQTSATCRNLYLEIWETTCRTSFEFGNQNVTPTNLFNHGQKKKFMYLLLLRWLRHRRILLPLMARQSCRLGHLIRQNATKDRGTARLCNKSNDGQDLCSEP